MWICPLQDLRCREEEVRRVRVQQKQIAEQLKKREEELHHRELDLLQREISIAIIQQQSAKPTPKKRKGKFKKKLLNRSHQISAPSGMATMDAEDAPVCSLATATFLVCVRVRAKVP